MNGSLSFRYNGTVHIYNLKIDEKGNVYSDANASGSNGWGGPITNDTFIIEDNIPIPIAMVSIYKTIFNNAQYPFTDLLNISGLLQNLKDIKTRPEIQMELTSSRLRSDKNKQLIDELRVMYPIPSELTQLKEENANIKCENKQLRDKFLITLRKLSSELTQLKEENANIKCENEQLRNDIHNYQQYYITSQSNETIQCKEKIANLKLAIKELKNDNQEFNHTFESMFDENDKLTMENEQLKERLRTQPVKSTPNDSITDSNDQCKNNIEFIIFENELEEVISQTRLTHTISLSY